MYDNSEDNSWSFAAGLFVGALLGAGLASLYTPRSGPQNREMVREKSLVLKDRVSDVATSTTTKVSDASSTVTDRVSAVAATVADRASSAVATVQEVATTAATKVSDVASTATEKVSDTASVAVAKVSDTASAAAAKVSEVASTATEKARDLTGRASDDVAGTSSTVDVEAPQSATEISSETLRIGAPTDADIASRISEPTTDVLASAPVVAAPISEELGTAATSYDAGANMLVTDTSEIEMNDAAQALESDEQFEVNPAATNQVARAYVASNESGSGEVRGTGESNQT